MRNPAWPESQLTGTRRDQKYSLMGKENSKALKLIVTARYQEVQLTTQIGYNEKFTGLPYSS